MPQPTITRACPRVAYTCRGIYAGIRPCTTCSGLGRGFLRSGVTWRSVQRLHGVIRFQRLIPRPRQALIRPASLLRATIKATSSEATQGLKARQALPSLRSLRFASHLEKRGIVRRRSAALRSPTVPTPERRFGARLSRRWPTAQQSRFVLIDSRPRRIFMHCQPWPNVRFCRRQGLSAVLRAEP